MLTGTVGFTDNSLNVSGTTPSVALTGVGQSNGLTQTQTITFPNPSAAPVTVGTSLPLTATASSGLPVTYTATPVNQTNLPGFAVLTDNAFSSSTQVITLTQVGHAIAQTITFNAIGTQLVGTPLVLNAMASSTLPVIYSASGACAVSGSVATFSAAGQCTITATQSGNAAYNAATPVSQTFSVLIPQTLSYSGPTAAPASTVALNLAAYFSGVQTSLTLSTFSPAAVCTVSGTSVTPVATGNCAITAQAPGAGNYAASNTVMVSIQVTGTSQTITFPPIGTQTVGTPLTLDATASSNLPVSYAVSGVCSVTGNVVTFSAGGQCTITASQVGTVGGYTAATPVSQTFTVTQNTQTISFGSLAAQTVGSPAVALSVSASSGLLVSVSATPEAVCQVQYTSTGGYTATFTQIGTCTLTATQSGNANYPAAAPVSQSVTVNGEAQTISVTEIPVETEGSTLALNNYFAASSGSR